MNGPYDQDNPPAPPVDGGGAAPPLTPTAMDSGAGYPDFRGGFRCAICAISWPIVDPTLFGLALDHTWEYREEVACPKCGDTISLFANMEPIEIEEAWSIVNHARFRDYFIEHRGWDPEDAD